MPYRKHVPREEKYEGLPLSQVRLLDIMESYQVDELDLQVGLYRIPIRKSLAKILDEVSHDSPVILGKTYDWKKDNKKLVKNLERVMEANVVVVSFDDVSVTPVFRIFKKVEYQTIFRIEKGGNYKNAKIMGMRNTSLITRGLESLYLSQPCYDPIY